MLLRLGNELDEDVVADMYDAQSAGDCRSSLQSVRSTYSLLSHTDGSI